MNENTPEPNKKESGLAYFILGLLAFAGLGLEALLAFFIEPVLYRSPMAQWGLRQYICHWVLTCLIWGIVVVALACQSRNRYGFNLLPRSSEKAHISLLQWLGIVGCVIFTAVISFLSWDGFKIAIEFERLGYLQFLFQYMYYLFEAALFSLVIVFTQKAGELWFKAANVPWGSVVVALTWGLAHALSKGTLLIGILAALGGFLYGIVYVLTGKNLKIAFPIIFIMFVI
ncbi:MAG: hypothetical protein LBN26_00110 [Christensenellaceae bacterium]|jgi:hypothetical protein|nr:hypothetical protein [Christensenellaceae bacterium]